MRTAKLLPKSSSLKPKNRCISRRCPVEQTGCVGRRLVKEDWKYRLARLVTEGGDCGSRYGSRQIALCKPPALCCLGIRFPYKGTSGPILTFVSRFGNYHANVGIKGPLANISAG